MPWKVEPSLVRPARQDDGEPPRPLHHAGDGDGRIQGEGFNESPRLVSVCRLGQTDVRGDERFRLRTDVPPPRRARVGWLLLIYRSAGADQLRSTVWRRIKSRARSPAELVSRTAGQPANERSLRTPPGDPEMSGTASCCRRRRWPGRRSRLVPGGAQRRVRGDRRQVAGLPAAGAEGVDENQLHLRRARENEEDW